MMIYFVFKGDRIDLYNTIFNLKDSFEEIGIDYLQLIRHVDSLLTSNLWVIPKIKRIRTFIEELKSGVGFFNEKQLLQFVQFTKKLSRYEQLGFTSYFEYECFGKIGDFYIPKEGFIYNSPNLLIETYYNL